MAVDIPVRVTGGPAAEAEFRRIGDSGSRNLRRIERAAKPAGFELRALSGISRELQLTLARGLGFAAIAGTLTQATREALAFGTAMAEVSTLLPDDADLRPLTDNIVTLTQQFGTAPTEQARALYQVISAGAATAAEANETLEAATRLAIGGVTGLTTAADGLTTVLNAYGNEVGSAADASDTFFIGVRAGKTTVEELSQSIGVAAPLAATLGVSFEETVAAAAALTKGGQSTRIAMTGLRAILVAITKPSKEAADEAERLGLQFDAAALQSRGLAGFLQDVTDKTEGSVESIGKLFGNVEALTPILSLTGRQASDFADILADMGDKAGATETAVRKMSEDAQFQINRLTGNFQLLGLAIGSSVTDNAVPALQFLNENFENIAITAGIVAGVFAGRFALSLAATGLAAFLPTVRNTVVALRLMATVAPATAAGLTAVAVAGGAARAALLFFVTNPIGIAITTAAVAFTVLSRNTDQARTAAERHTDSLQDQIRALREARGETVDLATAEEDRARALLAQLEGQLAVTQEQIRARSQEFVEGAAGGPGLFGEGLDAATENDLLARQIAAAQERAQRLEVQIGSLRAVLQGYSDDTVDAANETGKLAGSVTGAGDAFTEADAKFQTFINSLNDEVAVLELTARGPRGPGARSRNQQRSPPPGTDPRAPDGAGSVAQRARPARGPDPDAPRADRGNQAAGTGGARCPARGGRSRARIRAAARGGRTAGPGTVPKCDSRHSERFHRNVRKRLFRRCRYFR